MHLEIPQIHYVALLKVNSLDINENRLDKDASVDQETFRQQQQKMTLHCQPPQVINKDVIF